LVETEHGRKRRKSLNLERSGVALAMQEKRCASRRTLGLLASFHSGVLRLSAFAQDAA
jgi:hypothetical protein